MKVLYVTHYYPPEMGAPAARVSELAKYWTKEGNEVTVLTGFPNHPNGIVHPDYRSRFRRLFATEVQNGTKVVRTWLIPRPIRKSLDRILNYTSFCISAAIRGSFLRRPDVVIATSPQLLVGLSGWWIARLKRVPFIFEVRDLWPESLTGAGVGNSSSLVTRVLGAIAGFLYKRSDHIVVVTPAFIRELSEKWHVPLEKMSLVENGVEIDLFTPREDREDLKKELGLENKFVVSYVGTFGLAQGVGAAIEAAALVRDSAPDIAFLMVGGGAEAETVQSMAQSMSLQNVQFLPPVPREQVPKILGASDVCLVLLRKADIFTTVIPTKMLECMASARPVVLTANGQPKEVLERAGGGICVEPEAPPALAEAILQLYHDPSARMDFSQHGRQYIVEHLSRESTSQRYSKLLQDVVSGPRPH